jgi:hypothetical protein
MKKTLIFIGLILSVIAFGQADYNLPSMPANALKSTSIVAVERNGTATGDTSYKTTMAQIIALVTASGVNEFTTKSPVALANDTVYCNVLSKEFSLTDTVKTNRTVVLKSTGKITGGTEVRYYLTQGTYNMTITSSQTPGRFLIPSGSYLTLPPTGYTMVTYHWNGVYCVVNIIPIF